jgi:ketosteroid isomerase-like protein
MVGYFLDQDPDRKGYEEVWDYMMFLAEEFEEIHSEVEDLIEIDDRLVVPIRVTAKAARTGARGELRFTSVFTVRDGRIVEVRNYTGKEEALEALRQEPG